ncbi:MAG: phosphatidylserine/phosphatidylglycerophosphate/cardiolipin synthase family protein, partial [Candidatus Sericytochromatia bacterium]
MSKKSIIRKLTLAALAAVGLSACSKAPLAGGYPYPPMMAYGAPRAPLSAMAAGSGIQTFFVKAYGHSAAENEQAARRDPQGPAPQLIRVIDSAQQTLDGSFYDIDNADVVQALLRARQRGVRIRLTTDTDNLTAKNSGPQGPPREAIVALKQAGIPIVDDQRSGIMHNKFLVIDGQRVWTGSTNLTNTSLFQHNNNALLLNSPEMAATYSAEFERLFTQKIFGVNPPRQQIPNRFQIGQAQVEVYFSPRGGGQQAVLNELHNARQRIVFMTFSLTDKTAGEIIQQKAARGVKVDGVFDSWLGASQYSLYSPMRLDGIGVSKDGNEALLHHKVIIVDDTVITGSYNYSANAENSNNENFLIIRNAPAITQAYLDEFAR